MTRDELMRLQAWAEQRRRGRFTPVPRREKQPQLRRDEWHAVWERFRPRAGNRTLRRRLMRHRVFHGGVYGGPIA